MSAVSANPPHFDSVTPDLDGSLTAYGYFAPSEPVLRELVDELFGKNWAHITVGPCIEGAVFEIRFTQAPEIRISDGYLTVDLGPCTFIYASERIRVALPRNLKMRPVNKDRLLRATRERLRRRLRPQARDCKATQLSEVAF
jgi:hypothetical protein